MARVKTYNMGFDPNDVESGSNFVQHPAPTLVRVKITEADLGFVSSTGNKGIHLQFKILGSKPPKKGQQWATLHHYLTNTEAARWRFKELLEALGLPMKATLKESDLVGKVCLAKLRAEDYEGEHQAKIARLMNLDDEEDLDEDELEDDDEDESDDDEDNEPDEDEDEPDEEETDYNEWSLVQLRAELEARVLETTGRKKALVERLEEYDSADESDDEEDDEDEETVDYESMSLRELRVAAKEAGIATRGLDKDALIEALEEEPDDEPDEDEDEDDESDEEATDYSEWSLKDLRAEAKERKIKTVGLDKDALVEALTEDDGDPFEEDDE